MASRWVSVTGSRTYPVTQEQYDLLPPNEKLEAMDMGFRLVEFNIQRFPDDWGIVSGGARGVDRWAARAARERDMEFVEYPAEWDKFGKDAGRRRNQLIVQHADSCLIFWDGVSRGTKDLTRKAYKAQKEIWLIGPSGTPWAIYDAEWWEKYGEEPPEMAIPGE